MKKADAKNSEKTMAKESSVSSEKKAPRKRATKTVSQSKDEISVLKYRIEELSEKLDLMVNLLSEISERQEFSSFWQADFFQQHAETENHRWQAVEDLLNAQFGARASIELKEPLAVSKSPMETLKEISERHQKLRHLRKSEGNDPSRSSPLDELSESLYLGELEGSLKLN